MGLEKHMEGGPEHVKCVVIVTSDAREVQTDRSGNLIVHLLEGAGHEVVDYRIVRNDPVDIVKALETALGTSQAIIISGGTGVSKRDITVETVEPLLEKKLGGFGEIFRHLSFSEIGSAAMLSRAIAGTIGSRAIFCLPGSEGAVRLAMMKLIVPELSRIVGELEK